MKGTGAKIRNFLIALTVSAGVASTCFAEDWIYTTRPGDTIWDLTDKYAKTLGYVEALREHNGIEAPKRLQPGTKLRFPVRWLKTQPVSATVTEVFGSAWLTRSGTSNKTKLSVGDSLQVGDVVETDQDGNAVIEFADKSTLAIRAESRVEMDKLSAYGDTGMVDSGVRLQRGRANVRATPSKGPGTRFRINTPAAVSSVRGTGFRVSLEPDGTASRTEVTQGVVNVRSSGATRRVPERFGIIAEQGEPLKPPVELLPEADVSSLPALVERVPVKLDWQAIEGAQMYRVQVAKSDAFGTLFVDRTTTGPAVSFNLSEDGEYTLRLRGIAADKLEGVDADHRFVLNAFPEPPISMQPRPDETVRIPQPEFRWTRSESARSYLFQLARDAEFGQLVTDTEIAGGISYTPQEPLPEGRYFWRLATQDDSGETGPFGDAIAFSYTKPPPAPDLSETPPSISKEEVVLRWAEGIEGSSYRIQITRGTIFKKVIVDEVVSVPSYAIPSPKSGKYSVRIATIGPDGFEGDFSNPQSFRVPNEGKWWWPLATFVLAALLL